MQITMPSTLLIKLIKQGGFVFVTEVGFLLESLLTSYRKKGIKVWRETGSDPSIFSLLEHKGTVHAPKVFVEWMECV